MLRRIAEEFFLWQAHGGQREPAGQWRSWLLMAGRGFGKTLAGAHWVAARARAHRGAAIALVGGGRDEVVKVMIEGPSGLIATARAGEAVQWAPTRGELEIPLGREGVRLFGGGGRRNCAGRSIISPGPTSWRNGRRQGTARAGRECVGQSDDGAAQGRVAALHRHDDAALRRFGAAGAGGGGR